MPTSLSSLSSHRAWQRLDFGRFELLVIGVALALVIALGGVIAAGDRVGVYVAPGGYSPVGTVRGVEPVRVRFSDAMDKESVEARFTLDPAVAGRFSWSDARTVTFTPDQPFAPGQTYTVTIARGAHARQRDAVLGADLHWTFYARLPRVVYLGPAHDFARNLILLDLENGTSTPLTAAEYGVEDFAVSPDGSAIAYAQNNADSTTDVWLLDVASGATRPLTRCVDAICTRPSWTPDGTRITFQRQEFNAGQATGSGIARPWIVDPETLATGLLFDDPQLTGDEPTWSPDGQRVAVFDLAAGGIRVHDLQTGTDTLLDTQAGGVGAWSPDGTRLVFPVLARGLLGEQFYTHLDMVDFETETRTHLSGDDDAALEDGGAAWSPDGTRLVVARRYLDDRYTAGRQLYLLDPATGQADPLVVEPDYTHAAMHWDASGRTIVYQRFALADPDAQPEIWTVDVVTRATQLVAEDAFYPAWLP